MKVRIIIILALSSFLLLNFGCKKNAGNDTAPITYPIDISFTEIGKGALHGNGSENIPQQNIVITNQTQFNDLINYMNTANNVSNSFTETNVNFNNFILLAVFDSVKQNEGYSINIINVTENANNITVTIQSTYTPVITAVITQPYHIVKIPKITKPIVSEQ